MNLHTLPRITMEQARARGYVIDYPQHPAGVGTPISDIYGDDSGRTRSFDYFVVDPRTPIAGWLCEGTYSGPAFLAGRTREDALRAVEQSHPSHTKES
tara:strand:+ start:1792 stop:2085 length:294 start_codon:yes stop_codon:yes gene_type:complete